MSLSMSQIERGCKPLSKSRIDSNGEYGNKIDSVGIPKDETQMVPAPRNEATYY